MGSISGGRSGNGGRLLGALPLRVLAIAPLERIAAVVDAAVGADADVPVRRAVGRVARVEEAEAPLPDEARVLAVLVRRDLGGALLGVRVGDAFLVVAVVGQLPWQVSYQNESPS
jgi:hypothetical protein